ncbi:MAG TPA: FAD-dependent oxidoreductase [Acidobacteriaceae bacterium]
MKSADVAIAGGGIIGLATALELAAAGQKVTVFDRGESMSEASRAAAGMLAGTDPENPAELRELARLSLSLYPDFLARVEHLSGKKVPIHTKTALQGSKVLPAGVTGLTDSEVQELAPGADTSGWRFCLLKELSFDAWDLAEALPAAARAAGIEVREHTPVAVVTARTGGVELNTTSGPFVAGSFLNAAGAWASTLHSTVLVQPRKGHMLTVELPGRRQMHCVLRTPKVYIVPRSEGRYTIGPTLENAGFDKEVYADRIAGLYHKACDLWPLLRDARISETWVGLRPASQDGLPIIDRTDEGIWVATGHFKNGIMLAPGTARALSAWMTGRPSSVDLSLFRAGRFCAQTPSPLKRAAHPRPALSVSLS